MAGKSTSGILKDVVMLGGFQELEFDFVANNPGPTLFHCHQQLHMDFGFMALFDYADVFLVKLRSREGLKLCNLLSQTLFDCRRCEKKQIHQASNSSPEVDDINETGGGAWGSESAKH